ncbi:general secretion pathway protein I [Sphingomonas jinjuensis]|uniref:Type II secretion system protein I n=1 Tax=Sphingomonas jinjuensis TaxID=535907 RepID=A0A840F558_9SPHN|nr:type II secretion system minor pseudopilin GspI [Sphingomonas jinjuensis]MBB4153040.1 general secretion pathway protein I [Sphingomonas jinjuensis]
MRSDRGEEGGFTLIEIMVALAVFSLAALALVRLESATIRGATTLDDTLVGNMVARTIAVEAITEARAPALGTAAGVETSGGRSWRWRRVVRPTGNAEVVRVDVAVANARGQVVGTATAIRPPDVPVVAAVPAPSPTPSR